MSKEEFLNNFGEKVDFESQVAYKSESPDPSLLFVVLVLNPGFSAAGIAYSKREFKVFKVPDGRPKIWFLVPREDLYNVSDLENYLPKDQIYE